MKKNFIYLYIKKKSILSSEKGHSTYFYIQFCESFNYDFFQCFNSEKLRIGFQTRDMPFQFFRGKLFSSLFQPAKPTPSCSHLIHHFLDDFLFIIQVQPTPLSTWPMRFWYPLNIFKYLKFHSHLHQLRFCKHFFGRKVFSENFLLVGFLISFFGRKITVIFPGSRLLVCLLENTMISGAL